MHLIPVLFMVSMLCSGPSFASQDAAQPTTELWRVVSQRITLPEAAHTLQKKLQKAGLQPQLFIRHEAIELHVFDDPNIYRSHAAAEAARARWQQQGIDADIYPMTDHRFHIGLGRYYLDEYALVLQQQLQAGGHAFTYRRMQKTIPVYRLTFPPGKRRNAEQLWQTLHHTGLGNPVLMPETAFRELYSLYQPKQPASDQAPISSAKRSNR